MALTLQLLAIIPALYKAEHAEFDSVFARVLLYVLKAGTEKGRRERGV